MLKRHANTMGAISSHDEVTLRETNHSTKELEPHMDAVVRLRGQRVRDVEGVRARDLAPAKPRSLRSAEQRKHLLRRSVTSGQRRYRLKTRALTM